MGTRGRLVIATASIELDYQPIGYIVHLMAIHTPLVAYFKI